MSQVAALIIHGHLRYLVLDKTNSNHSFKNGLHAENLCQILPLFIFPTSKTRLSRKLQTPLLSLWQYCTLTLETVNLLKPSGIRYFVLLSLPYPMLGIRYWPLNFLLTLLSIPFGLRQLGYMKKIFLSILQLKRSLFEQRLKLRSTRHCLLANYFTQNIKEYHS